MIKLLGGDSKVVDPAAQMEEWTDEDGGECKGMKIDGKLQGIVRKIAYSHIELKQYNENQTHGLSITWWYNGHIKVGLYKNNKLLGRIVWNTKDWTEYESHNPSVFDGVLSINDFRP